MLSWNLCDSSPWGHLCSRLTQPPSLQASFRSFHTPSVSSGVASGNYIIVEITPNWLQCEESRVSTNFCICNSYIIPSNYLMATEVSKKSCPSGCFHGFSRMGKREPSCMSFVLQFLCYSGWLSFASGDTTLLELISCPIWMPAWPPLFRPSEINFYPSPEWEGRRSSDNKILVKISLLTCRRQVDSDRMWLNIIWTIAMLNESSS